MVSFEVQARAEFLIGEVKSIGQINDEFRETQHKFLKNSSDNRETLCHVIPVENCSLNGDDIQATLADDLSSHGSDLSLMDRDDAFPLDQQHNSDLLEWREQFLTPGKEQSLEDLHKSVAQCKMAMYQMMLNSDLKMRKLQSEVIMLRRVYEDAKFTIERYENKIDSLECRLYQSKKNPNQSGIPAEIDVPSSADLRMENHLNKLVASRSKALDENMELKKKLIACCPTCRRIDNPAKSQNRTNEDEENAKDDDKRHQPQIPAPPRRTFQKTAFALVQRMGKRPAEPSTRDATSENNDHLAKSKTLPENVRSTTPPSYPPMESGSSVPNTKEACLDSPTRLPKTEGTCSPSSSSTVKGTMSNRQRISISLTQKSPLRGRADRDSVKYALPSSNLIVGLSIIV